MTFFGMFINNFILLKSMEKVDSFEFIMKLLEKKQETKINRPIKYDGGNENGE